MHPSPDHLRRSEHVYDDPRPDRGSARELPPRTSPSTAGWVALVIWSVFALLAIAGTIGVVSAFARFTQGLEAPTNLLSSVPQQQSVVTDRNGVEMARFGGERREVVAFKDIPPVI